MPNARNASIPQLLQRFKALAVTGFTFLCLAWLLAGPTAAALPAFLDRAPLPVEAPTDPDILTTLRSGFALRYEDNQRTAAERNWFVRHPDYLERVFTRAKRYLPYIVAELKRRDMPLELALLPIVESAYDPFAYSHGRAAGLWQMIPGTARRFGIKQNWWYDGRRDVVDSTRAALDYLEHLHKLNDGDWLNAIASYNSGEGNVLRAARRNRNAGKPIDFWNLKLPRETSMYVPKLLALVEIVLDPTKHGLALPEVPDTPQFRITEVGSQIDLALAAELAGVDIDTVYQYNPGNNRWSTDPAGPHRLVMPIAVADQFVAAVNEVPPEERVRWKRHKVKSGEAISQIAERYNTTVSTIRSANNLKGNTIRAGHYLMIPVATKPLHAYSKSADADFRKRRTGRARATSSSTSSPLARASGRSPDATTLRTASWRPGTAWRRATRCPSAENLWFGRETTNSPRTVRRPIRRPTRPANCDTQYAAAIRCISLPTGFASASRSCRAGTISTRTRSFDRGKN